MAKFFIAIVLIAILSLGNKRFCRHLHVHSHPSSELDDFSQHLRHLSAFTSSSTSSTHNQKQRSTKPNQQESTTTNENSDTVLRDYLHMQKHFRRQAEHQKHHRDHYKTRKAELTDLKSMPRLWQHFQMPGDHMFGDEPMLDSNEETDMQQNLDEEIPSYINEKNYRDGLDNSEEYSSYADINIKQEETQHTHEQYGSSTTMRCPKCESSHKVEHISEEELTQLRIAFVKQQILEKLRLKERPNVSAVGLPKPIYEGTTIEEQTDGSKNKDLDDYYARTSKKFIFLQREKRECKRLDAHPSMCFSFKIDDADADSFDVNTAVLWLFKNKQNKLTKRNDTTLLEQQTIVVSEVQQQLDSKYLPIVKTIAIQTVDVQDEWMKIDIEWPIKRWFGNHDLSHLIQISCQSCDINSMDEMISVDKDYRPFIMVDTQNRRRTSRKKRGINCTDGVTECCREKLYISFDEIGWGDWIIQPRGYDAYFCRGSCGSIASVTQSSSHHTTILQKAFSSHRSKGGKPLELIPCCTAKQYSSLQLVFMDSNNTATQKTFPNMVVESCGCR